MIWIVLTVTIILFAFLIYINARLFAYIKNLEGKIEKQVEKNENMYQSLKELVQDDFLLSDGRLKKFAYEKERNRIYNGVALNEQEVNF